MDTQHSALSPSPSSKEDRFSFFEALEKEQEQKGIQRSAIEGHLVKVIALLKAIRAKRPTVLCLVRESSSFFIENVLLSLGANPLFVEDWDEFPSFSKNSHSFLLSLDASSKKSFFLEAAGLAKERNLRWVLDAAQVDCSAVREKAAQQILQTQTAPVIAPDVLYCSQKSWQILKAQPGLAPEASLSHRGICIAVTGKIYYVEDANSCLGVGHKHKLTEQVSSLVCGISAIMSAFLGEASADPFTCAMSAFVLASVAGEGAAEKAGSPGSFPSHFLDFLYKADDLLIRNKARILLQPEASFS